jgi:AraC-like DNA-binding protein
MLKQDIVTLPSELTVIDAGIVAGNRHPDRTIDHWVLGTIAQGRMELGLGDHVGAISAGSYYLLPPGIPHYGPGRSRFNVAFWHFRSHAGPACYRLPLVGRVPAELDHLGLVAQSERLRTRGDDPRWVADHLRFVLSRLASANRDGPSPAGTEDAIMGWLQEHRGKPWSRQALEREFGRSYRHLNRGFSARFGRGIRDLHLDLRVRYAADLIAHGATLAEAAAQAGFNDYFNFLRRFHQRFGRTPGQVRADAGARH